jgi:hypothetical protein
LFYCSSNFFWFSLSWEERLGVHSLSCLPEVWNYILIVHNHV